MSQTKKVVLAIFTVYPMIYILFFMIFMVSMTFSMFQGIEEPGFGEMSMFFDGFPVIFIFHIITMFVSLALIIIYIVLVVKNEYIDQSMRIVWLLIIIFGGMIGMAVYWYLYVWKEGKREPLM